MSATQHSGPSTQDFLSIDDPVLAAARKATTDAMIAAIKDSAANSPNLRRAREAAERERRAANPLSPGERVRVRADDAKRHHPDSATAESVSLPTSAIPHPTSDISSTPDDRPPPMETDALLHAEEEGSAKKLARNNGRHLNERRIKTQRDIVQFRADVMAARHNALYPDAPQSTPSVGCVPDAPPSPPASSPSPGEQREPAAGARIPPPMEAAQRSPGPRTHPVGNPFPCASSAEPTESPVAAARSPSPDPHDASLDPPAPDIDFSRFPHAVHICSP